MCPMTTCKILAHDQLHRPGCMVIFAEEGEAPQYLNKRRGINNHIHYLNTWYTWIRALQSLVSSCCRMVLVTSRNWLVMCRMTVYPVVMKRSVQKPETKNVPLELRMWLSKYPF